MRREKRATTEAREQQPTQLSIYHLREKEHSPHAWVHSERTGLLSEEEGLELVSEDDVGDPNRGETDEGEEGEEEVGGERSEEEDSEEDGSLEDTEESREVGESEGRAEEDLGVEGKEKGEEDETKADEEGKRMGTLSSQKQVRAQTGGAVVGVV